MKRSKWPFRILTALVVLGIAGYAVYRWGVHQTQQVPEFYRLAKQNDAADIQIHRRSLDEEVKRLQEEAGKRGSWNATFTTDEVNAWLQVVLPMKFPRLNAKGASEPRIAIKDGKILAAAQYKKGDFETVVSCEITVKLTNEPNRLAVKVSQLRAGALSLPLDQFTKGISREAARGELDVEWEQNDGDLIALLRVPSDHPRYVVRPVIIESIEVQEGMLKLTGQSGESASQSYFPRGNVYRIASQGNGGGKSLSSGRNRQSHSLPH